MAWWTTGATALLLGSIAPAFAQGPMSPIPLAADTYQVTSEVPSAPPPPIPPAPAVSPTPATAVAAAKPGRASQKQAGSTTQADLDGLSPVKDPDAIAAMGSDPATDDASTIVSNGKKRRSRDTSDSTRVDPDHMAGMLNRLQLSGSIPTQ